VDRVVQEKECSSLAADNFEASLSTTVNDLNSEMHIGIINGWL